MTLVQILLPLVDNAGRRFPRRLHESVRDELLSRFGGVTAYNRAPATGLWAPEGEKGEKVTEDDIVIYEVMAETLDRAWWTRYRERLQARFEQESLVIRATAIETF